MKKYIGEGLIEAEPMNLWDAVKKDYAILGDKLTKDLKFVEGYHIKFDNGVDSWLPKEQFEKDYKEFN